MDNNLKEIKIQHVPPHRAKNINKITDKLGVNLASLVKIEFHEMQKNLDARITTNYG